MKPIPKRMLQKSIIVKSFTGSKGGLQASRTLKGVKLDNKKTYTRGTNGFEVIGKAVLFIDAVNSKIDGVTVSENDFKTKTVMIYRQGLSGEKTFSVIDITAEEDNDKIHHWELVLA